MKDEYDFSDAEQGKFYRPLENLDIPVYLDREVRFFFADRIKRNQQNAQLSLNEMVNTLLKKDIEISKQLAS